MAMQQNVESARVWFLPPVGDFGRIPAGNLDSDIPKAG